MLLNSSLVFPKIIFVFVYLCELKYIFNKNINMNLYYSKFAFVYIKMYVKFSICDLNETFKTSLTNI